MIIAKYADDDGNPGLLIGLSRINMEKLMEGQPILKGPDDIQMPLTLVIVGGETEDAITAELKQHFDFAEGIIDLRTGGN